MAQQMERSGSPRWGHSAGPAERGDARRTRALGLNSQGLCASPPQRERRARALVVVQRGGARIPFHCVHGAGGNVLGFRGLSRALHPAQPFYGLQAIGSDGVTPPHESIEEMAASYLSEIHELQPRGPYLLGGYSAGGIVAFEMARRLTEAGERVALLALIDTLHPESKPRELTIGARLARLREEGLPYLADSVRRRWDAIGLEADRLTVEACIARGEPIPFALREMHLIRSFRRAVSRYETRPWRGEAVLFRASEVPFLYRHLRPSLGWERHILGGVRIVAVGGSHFTVLRPGNEAKLADALREEIEKAQLGGGAA